MTIEQIILVVSARVLERITKEGRCDNYEESPYYDYLTKEEKKMLSDYIVNKYSDDWDWWEDDPMYSPKSMYNMENIYKYLIEELREMS